MNTHKRNSDPIIGLDEVGRGAWAGPVVAGCCAFLEEPIVTRVKRPSGLEVFVIKGDEVLITDSKKMTVSQREIAAEWLYLHASAIGIGAGSVSLINGKGIVKAAHAAFRQAFKEVQNKLQVSTKTILLDAFYVPRLGNTKIADQIPIIRGDQKELSIAAASIVAKVYRDKLMEKLSATQNKRYQVYGWERNKGYGTTEHQAALKKYGTTNKHRTLFIRNCVEL